MTKQTVIPTDSKYIPLTQQRWCCVPTCIQIVMLRYNIPLISAELIGYELGLIVPRIGVKLFWNPRTGRKPKSGFGTQKDKPQYGPNKFFKKYNIPFKMRWDLISKFKDYRSFLNYLNEIQETQNILICFDWGTLFKSKYHGGHVCLIDKIYMEKELIRIVDPEQNAPKWRIIKMKKLFEAMKFHTNKNSGGFWEIKYID